MEKYRSLLLISIVVAVAVFVGVVIFKVSLGALLLAGMFLACPLVHIWMMKDGGHKHS